MLIRTRSSSRIEGSPSKNIALGFVELYPTHALPLTALRVARPARGALCAHARQVRRDAHVVDPDHVSDPRFVIQKDCIRIMNELVVANLQAVEYWKEGCAV